MCRGLGVQAGLAGEEFRELSFKVEGSQVLGFKASDGFGGADSLSGQGTAGAAAKVECLASGCSEVINDHRKFSRRLSVLNLPC